jgi:flagellar hook protein FlgE
MDVTAASLSGLQVSAQRVATAANNIANSTTPGYQTQRLDQEDQIQGGVRPTALQTSREVKDAGSNDVDLATEAVALKTGGLGYEANLKVLQVQNQLLGTVMDMKA